MTATALGHLAATDWSERRVPRRTFRVGAALAATTIVAVCWARGEWLPLVRFGVGAVLVLAGLGSLWWVKPEALGLGDVKATSLATASSAAVSWRTASNMMLATALAGLVVVGWFAVARRIGNRGSKSTGQGPNATVPFVPPLCVGFVIGVGVS